MRAIRRKTRGYLTGIILVGSWVLINTCLWMRTYINSESDKLPTLEDTQNQFLFPSHGKREETEINNEIQDNLFNFTPDGKPRPWHNENALIMRTQDCQKYFKSIPVLGSNKTFLKTEARKIHQPSPLAFSHLVHKDIAIFEVFLSLYFRPNNFHCIHVDRQADDVYKQAVNNLVKCYSTITDNGAIFTIPEYEAAVVDWGRNTMLQADMKCLDQLIKYKKSLQVFPTTISWSHSISVDGSELPLVTYSTFHNMISKQLGQNLSSIQSVPLPSENFDRISKKQWKDQIELANSTERNIFEIRNPLMIPKSNVMWGDDGNQPTMEERIKMRFKVFTGVRNVILSSKDAEFFMNHPVANAFYKWIQQGTFTQELFFSTLIRFHVDTKTNIVTQDFSNSKVIGRNSGGMEFTKGNTLHRVCPRFTIRDCSKCVGKCINKICNFNVLDLEKLGEDFTDCLIANKFNIGVDPFAVAQHWMNIFQKTAKETYEAERDKNMTSYKEHALFWNDMIKKLSVVQKNT